MKIVFYATLVFFVVFAGAFAQSAEDGAQKGFLMALEPLAERGDTTAQLVLAKAYLTGENLTKDLAKASKWFRRAAEKGNDEAAFTLGLLYLQGAGVEKDLSEGLKWLRKSGEQGFAQAQEALGDFYSNGHEDIKPDWKEALVWYRKAAEQGKIGAQRSLGTQYMVGLSVEKNTREAIKWFRKAAEHGDIRSQYSLALIYAEGGEGVERDYIEAYAWLNLAAAGKASGTQNRISKETLTISTAKMKLDEMEVKLAPQQIAEGQKRTKELKAIIEKSLKSSSGQSTEKNPNGKALK